jgi:glycolate oxidase
MIPDSILRELAHVVGPRHLISQGSDLIHYSRDATKLEFVPDAVAFPGTSEEISRIFHLANRDYFPVIPRGAGSGKTGGALPVRGGLVLAMDRFSRILSIDPDNLIARVEPGVITARFQDEVEKLNLFYPPDPASIKISTIGGNVAECAGGLRAFKYGVTRDYVLGLKVVLPTGEIVKTGVETAKGVAGYDLTRLIVGSEGTLAVITAVTLRLIPKPDTINTMVAFFQDVPSAVTTVSALIRHKIIPTTLEFMDRLCINCARHDFGLSIPTGAGAMLLIEVDGHEAMANHQSKEVEKICVQCGAMHFEAAAGEKEAEQLWETRRYISEALMKLRPDKVSEDIVVPRTQMAQMLSFLDWLSLEYGLPIPAFGHAGDGNIHVNIMFDGAIPEEVHRVDLVVREVFRKVLDLGGTITGEHGIGITKSPYVDMEISPPVLGLMARLKKAFDPKGVLNPGKIFPLDLAKSLSLHQAGSGGYH